MSISNGELFQMKKFVLLDKNCKIYKIVKIQRYLLSRYKCYMYIIPWRWSSEISQIRIPCTLLVFTAFEKYGYTIKNNGLRWFIKIIQSFALENQKKAMCIEIIMTCQ